MCTSTPSDAYESLPFISKNHPLILQVLHLSSKRMDRLKEYFVFAIIVCSIASCGSKKHAAGPRVSSFAGQCVYLDSLDYNDVFTAEKFDSLADQLELDGYAAQAANARLYALRGKSFESRNEPAVERMLNNLLTKAQRRGWVELEAEVRQMTGEHYWHAKSDKKSGLMQYYRASQLYKNLSPAQYPHKFKHLFVYASAYNMFKDVESATTYYKQAIALGEYYDKGLFISAHNSLGLCYRDRGMIDSAITTLEKGLQFAQENQKKVWVAIIEGNLGAIYFLQNKPDKAEPLLLKEVARGAGGNDWRSAASSLLYLSQIALQRANPELAMKNAQLARTYISNIKGKEFNILLRAYDQLSKLYAGQGQFAEAYSYNDSARQVRDTLQQQYGQLLLLRTRQKMDEEKYTSELNATVQKNKYLRNVLVTVIILVMIIALLLLGRLRIKHQQKQKKLEDEQRNMQRELEIAASQLIVYTRHIEEKNELIEQFKKQADQAAQPPSDPESLSRLERLVILTDEQWDEFSLLFEKVHGNFFQRLREKIPGLSPADTRFAALSKLRLPIKSMASMLGITTNGVRMSKYRIMKKLNIEKDEDLEKLIQDI
jgi:DNA-binding CsgD family transcriptional regulator